MMKKAISILIMINILLGGTIAYAESSTLATTAPSTRTVSTANMKSRPGIKLYNAKKWIAATKEDLALVASNKEEINSLKRDSQTAYKSAKSRIRELIKNKDSMTDKQIQALKQAVSALTKDKQNMESTIGNINSESLKLKAAREARDLAAYQLALKNILAIQDSRIDVLKSVIDDMNKISEM